MGNRLIRLRCLPTRRDRKNKADTANKANPSSSNKDETKAEKNKPARKGAANQVASESPEGNPPSSRVMQLENTGFTSAEGTPWDDKVLTSLLGGLPTNLEDMHAVEIENGLLERGPVVLSDGSVYCGQWKDKVRHGMGKHYAMDGTRYVGPFENGQYHGIGEINYMNGDNFKGVFRNGLKNGKGVMVYKNGDIFDGNWVNGLRDGFGVERFSDGSVYMGSFKNDKREGRGELKFSNGAVYEGTFDNEITGVGKMSWPNGETYVGEFKNGHKHRCGLTTYKSGPVLSEKGTYDMGRMNGVFECCMRNGYVMKCVYKDGKFFQDVTNRKDIELFPSCALPEALDNEMHIVEESSQQSTTKAD